MGPSTWLGLIDHAGSLVIALQPYKLSNTYHLRHRYTLLLGSSSNRSSRAIMQCVRLAYR
jgi:hypothetical protein